jgi:hypothetical protein
MDSFWRSGVNKTSSNNPNKFDAFSNFFPTSNEAAAKKLNNLTDMYD